MGVDTQLVGLYCQPASMTHTQEGATTSGKTAKEAVLEAMKSQFCNVYGIKFNDDVFSTQGLTGTSSSLVDTKEKYDNLVKALQLYPTTEKKDQL